METLQHVSFSRSLSNATPFSIYVTTLLKIIAMIVTGFVLVVVLSGDDGSDGGGDDNGDDNAVMVMDVLMPSQTCHYLKRNILMGIFCFYWTSTLFFFCIVELVTGRLFFICKWNDCGYFLVSSFFWLGS